MGALPKQRVSRGHQGNRRAHDRLKPVQLMHCPSCHALKLPHHVCPTCGTYKGQPVLRLKTPKQKSGA